MLHNLDQEDSSVEAEVALVNMFVNDQNKKKAFKYVICIEHEKLKMNIIQLFLK